MKIEIEIWNLEEAKIAGAAVVGIQALRDRQHTEFEKDLTAFEPAVAREPNAEPAVVAEPAPTSPAPTVTDEQVNAATKTYANENGVPKVREILNEFGVKRAPEIPQEKRAEYLARLV